MHVVDIWKLWVMWKKEIVIHKVDIKKEEITDSIKTISSLHVSLNLSIAQFHPFCSNPDTHRRTYQEDFLIRILGLRKELTEMRAQNSRASEQYSTGNR